MTIVRLQRVVAMGAIDEAGCERKRELAKIVFNASTWQPLGDRYYTRDLTTITTATVTALLQTQARIMFALSQFYAHAPLHWARDEVARSLEVSSTITTAIANANRQGATVIVVPGFQTWCQTALNRCANAIGEITYLECIRLAQLPGILIDSIYNTARQVGAVAQRVVITTGQVVYAIAKLPGDIADVIVKLVRYSMYAGVGVAAYYLIKPRKKNPARRRRR